MRPHGSLTDERRVVALPHVGDKLCATTRVATLETPRHCRRIGSLQASLVLAFLHKKLRRYHATGPSPLVQPFRCHSSTAGRNPSSAFVHSFFFNFIVDFLLGLHAFLTVSSFHDGPMASLGHDPPANEQIVAIAPIGCRDSGDDRCCLRFLKALTK